MKIKMVIAEADIPNRNGRIYSRKLLEESVKDFNQLTMRCGEFGSSGDVMIDLWKISHKVDNVKFEGNKLYGDFIPLDNTIRGEILKKYIKNDNSVGCEICGYYIPKEDESQEDKFVWTKINLLPKENCAWEQSGIIEVAES